METERVDISIYYEVNNKHYIFMINEEKIRNWLQKKLTPKGFQITVWRTICLQEKEILLAELLSNSIKIIKKGNKKNLFLEYLEFSRTKNFAKLNEKIIYKSNSSVEPDKKGFTLSQ